MKDVSFSDSSEREEGFVRSNRLRRRRLKRRRKMEGIRLRSDLDGSTKNAFYQGTIVSDAHQASEDDIYQIKESNSSLISSRQKQNILSAESWRSKLPAVSEDYYRTPSLPRRSSSRSSDDSKNGISRIVSPDTIGSGDDDYATFDFGNPVPDSLRYSTQSGFSATTQQSLLFGVNVLSDEEGRAEQLPLGSPVSSEGELDELEEVAFSEAPEDPFSSREILRGTSFVSVSSGVYFNHPAPPGPLQNGMAYGSTQPRQSRTVVQFPVQQSTSTQYHGYDSNAIPKRRKGSQMYRKSPEPTIEEDDNEDDEGSEEFTNLSERILDWMDISIWLSKDVSYDELGVPYFEISTNWSIAGIIRWLFFNPFYPEFTSQQQFAWAVVLGILMGVFTAAWKLLIEACVELIWKTLPEKFLAWGLFTDLDGAFPLYHYMWIAPSLLGGLLSYVITAMETPIPTQNDWIHTLHSRGVEESDTFIPLFFISTIGMSSGLSLGPELPLVLAAGMIGSSLGVLCRQSMLQARVMNLTAASAAISGFFGLPMAGALFVLELPHRMGLQYFEALSPATIASIVAVLINRIVINNDVTGMFQYPFLNESLPTSILKDAIVYGLFGGALGIFYTLSIKKLKTLVNHLLDDCGVSTTHESRTDQNFSAESTPLFGDVHISRDPSQSQAKKTRSCFCHMFSGKIPHKPTRAALTGTLAGLAVGVTGIFLPHVMFWGEAQLQTMIDKGRTPLPVFGQGDEPTAALVALGQCMINPSNGSGFSLWCSLAIVLAKIFVTGVSIGTGIVGGHFWGPLFVGCVASHFFTGVMKHISTFIGTSFSLSQYPCVALLCIMGATHVVTFRAHIAIILILTLTIDAFVPEGSTLKVAGDYAAVFPLLTVAVFVALQVSVQVVFYEKQRSRGDIQALPEALCEPGKEGKPWVVDYEGKLHTLDEVDYEYATETDYDSDASPNNVAATYSVSRADIEANLPSKRKNETFHHPMKSVLKSDLKEEKNRVSPEDPLLADALLESFSDLHYPSKSSKEETERVEKAKKKNTLKNLDELLNGLVQDPDNKDHHVALETERAKTHRRTQSEPFLNEDAELRMDIMWQTTPSASSTLRRPMLKRVDSYGEIDQGRPSLMDQVRGRAASERVPR